MQTTGGGCERKPLHMHTSIVFFASVFLVFSCVIFPVSATLNGTETLISTDFYKTLTYPPAIYKDLIAWSTQEINDDPSSGYNSRYIAITNMTSGDQFPIPSPITSWNSAPSLDNTTLVWMQDPDGVNFNIIAYDVAASSQLAEIPVTPGDYYSDPKNNVFPEISGTSLVWQDYANSNWDIFYYNLTWTPGTPPQQIITGVEDQKNPAIYGDYIVYENRSGFSSTIDLYNISASTSVQISTSADDVTPVIDGTNIVWQNLSPTGNKRIILYNITTGETRLIPPAGTLSDQTNPKISGNYIVWEDTRDRNPCTDIYLYDLTDGSERLLTPGSPGDKSMPAVSGNRIVWQDTRAMFNGGYHEDIYLLTLGAAETCPGADFTANYLADPPGGLVTFTDTTSPGTSPITYRLWNFSDGSAWENDPAPVTTHTFSQDGIFMVKMTVGNAKCRNISSEGPGHTIFINSPPVANFTAVPPEGLSPLTVTFTDASSGAPTTLSWDFGDGSPLSAGSPVTHTFTETGKEYSVVLTATNGHGSSTATKNIRTLMGAHAIATIPVNGISIDNRFGGQFLTYDPNLLPDVSLSGSSLVSHPPPQSGWQNITFVTADGTGISTDPVNGTYYANISRIYLTSNDTIATTTGSVPAIGNNWGVTFQINTTGYPLTAAFETDIREGASAHDRAVFDDLASKVQPSGTLVRDIAYTATFTRQNITSEGISLITMSVAEDWVKGPASSVAEGRNYTYVIAYGYDSPGNKRGGILSRQYIFSRNGLDYYEVAVPESAGYLSTFAMAKLSGSGNPIQLVTLTLVSIIGPESDTGGSGDVIFTPGDVKVTQTPEIKPTSLPGTGKTARLYTNDHGIITQATTLQAADGLGTVFIGRGVVVKNSTGTAPSSITINSVPADTLPDIPDGSGFSYAGMAYDLQPDGCTFSPAISLNFTIPQASRGQEFLARTYDETTTTWLEVPTTYYPDNGIVTAELSHFCPVALFARAVLPAPPDGTTDTPAQIPAMPDAPPAPTAFSTFSSMILWVIDSAIKNIILTSGLVILAAAIFLYGRKRRRDRIMYLL